MIFERTFDILWHLKENDGKQDILCTKKNGSWTNFTVDEYFENARSFAKGLIQSGYKKGDKIATISNNRPEWNFVDMGMSMAGIIHVPIYPTISEEEFSYIFNHSGVKMVIVSDNSLYKKIKPIADNTPHIESLYTFNKIEGALHWSEIIRLGQQHRVKLKPVLESIKKGITADDTASIIYTSGTTGMPKGVMLSHGNFMNNVNGVWDLFDLYKNTRVLSFLPLCHVYERMVNYLFQAKQCCIYYAENLGTIAPDMASCKANAFATVPRVIERIYDRIVSKGEDLNGAKKAIFFWAMRLGEKYSIENNNNAIYKIKLKIARKLVFSKWQETFGGELKFVISGGAALQPRLSRLFFAAGIHLMEGYGLTETAPVIAANFSVRPNNLMIGTVGPILNNIEVKIDEDGEILTKGPCVMKGYYNAPELTEEVIDGDGWFHTGDIGQLVDGKFLKITDRKKEMFKTSSGKYIAPQTIENLLKESIFIEQAMVVGESEKYASALISPNFDYLHMWAHDHKIHFRDNKELVRNPKILKVFNKEVHKTNKLLGQHEQIKRFRIVCEPWTSASGELSATLKLKRRVLYNKYADLLRKIYSYEPDQDNRGSISFNGD
ncbi:AMP-dependent synthetase/ligase [Plebeiibacterium marinum]|uniref:Long-chain fatty acid--CoA ligase n=1 Tax=Plebeiibacterium marinum TaxID=2992111 RepID=A0AAE3MC08_9BACT|nr:long-chain fatty acid--CoA ligase [Plebeiobacterium marinum]MCW3804986.1 long-chain fatty acid--CoA ligase [Plebeiobacterium marinum]